MTKRSGMSISVDLRDLKRPPTARGAEAGPQWRLEMLRILAIETVAVINARVDQGQSLHGGAFTPYTPSYADWKRARGRSPGSQGDWLTYTGQMMASLGITELDARHFFVGFQGTRTEGVSNALLAYANDRIRPFVGLNEPEKVRVINHTIAHAKRRGLI